MIMHQGLLRRLADCFTVFSELSAGVFSDVDGDICYLYTFASAVTAQIITACRMDPATCTHTTLEELDPYIICRTCTITSDSSGFHPTMRWTQGVRFKLKSTSAALANP